MKKTMKIMNNQIKSLKLKIFLQANQGMKNKFETHILNTVEIMRSRRKMKDKLSGIWIWTKMQISYDF